MTQTTLSERPYVNSNLFSGYYLDERLKYRDEWNCDDEAAEAMAELRSLYELEGGLVEGYNEDSLIDDWIDEVLDILGFGTQVKTALPETRGFVDVLLFESDMTRRDAAAVYGATQDSTDLFERGVGLLEAKQWNADFTKRFSEQRPYRNASHQIKHYLEQTPENIQWGILTNGRKWRLYGTKDYETQTYYEIDLPELLERDNLEAFKYFYLFFRPAAFRKSAGTIFFDEVWSESETTAQELGEDLQDNVFTALRVLGRGFVEANDLNIDPDDQERLDELKNQSLVLLYRLMFILYAEARGLIHPEGPAPKEEYQENFSLDTLCLDIHDTIGEVDEGFNNEFSKYSTSMWNRLEDLFRLIDKGEESLGIPPYNGGLFDHNEHTFLTEHEVSNRYLAEVIYRLSTTQNSDGRYVLADYADLDTRHLGSVYEGLLEHQFQIAPEQYAAITENSGQVWKPATEVTVADAVETVPEGGLYVVNDEDERKATGAYYTPDYVVTYIVEETVGLLVDEIRDELIDQEFEPGTQEYLGPFLRRVTDLKILDPAMGSGHFLTKVTGYLAEEIMSEVRDVENEIGVTFDEQYVRREIAKECIYGVDVNGMAVELAKLSMWLETLAADRPLAFLDHHFKEGNSLVGSDIEDIEQLESDANDDDKQYSLAEFGATREGTIERLMDIYSEFLAIENNTVEDVHKMKRKYAEIEQDELRRRLVAMVNVHTAERFDLDVPGGAYEQMARVLENNEKWSAVEDTDWFRTAQEIADHEKFFHWQLEFPEVFFEANGEKRENAGFDAVVSNPPYIKTQNLRDKLPNLTEYLMAESRYTTAKGRFDIYAPFVEQGTRLAARNNVSYILPNKFFTRKHGEPLRRYLTTNRLIREIVNFGQSQVFTGVTTYTCILSLGANCESFDYLRAVGELQDPEEIRTLQSAKIEIDGLDADPWVLTGPKELRVLKRMESLGDTIEDVSEEIAEGITSGDNDVFFVEIQSNEEETTIIRSPADGNKYVLEQDLVRPITDGDDINRFQPPQTDFGVIYPYTVSNGRTHLIPENQIERDYPRTYSYLSQFRERLANRGTERTNKEYKTWYALYRARDMEVFEQPKLLTPDICGQSEFSMDDIGGLYFRNSAFGFVPMKNEEPVREFYLSVLNSTLTWFYIYQTSTILENDFRRFTKSYLSPLPIPEVEPKSDPDNKREEYDKQIKQFYKAGEDPSIEEPTTFLAYLGRAMFELQAQRGNLNLNITDYLGTYRASKNLMDIGLTQPPENIANSILRQTTEQRPNLRVGKAEVVRESLNTLEIRLTARYKPDEKTSRETDQWGYTETKPMPAMRLTNLSKTEIDLIEVFVPIAVKKANGFANFRETATKTNSLVDRLEALTLPDPNEVTEDLERYLDATDRAEKLDEKIEKTDSLIDEIVYELYGLSNEEVDIVEEAVAND